MSKDTETAYSTISANEPKNSASNSRLSSLSRFQFLRRGAGPGYKARNRIQKVGKHEIRHTSKGLNVEPNVGDDVLIELIGRAVWSSGFSTPDRPCRRRESSGGIAITANAMEPDIEKCFAVGMNGHVSKPVRTSELQAALNRWQPAGLKSISNAIPQTLDLS